MRKILISALALAVSGSALAQNVPNHAIPIGAGPGVIGWHVGGPCASGQSLVYNNATTDPVCRDIPNSGTLEPANTVFAGPTTGVPAAPTFRALVGADLPNPSATTLGGVQSKTAVANQFLTSISTLGVPVSAQPSFANISGTIASGQVSGSYTGITGVGTLTAGVWNATPITNANLATAGANTVKGNFTAGTASVADNAMPSCADTGNNHLNYVAGTGIVCGTSGTQVLLNTLTASASANLQDTTSLTGTFSSYEIVITNLLPATNATQCQILIRNGGVFQTTSYIANFLVASGAATTVASSTTFIPCSSASVSNGAGTSGLNAKITIFNPAGTTNNKALSGTFMGQTGSVAIQGTVGGTWTGGTGAVDGIQVQFSAGNITSGTVKIYGIL